MDLSHGSLDDFKRHLRQLLADFQELALWQDNRLILHKVAIQGFLVFFVGTLRYWKITLSRSRFVAVVFTHIVAVELADLNVRLHNLNFFDRRFPRRLLQLCALPTLSNSLLNAIHVRTNFVKLRRRGRLESVLSTTVDPRQVGNGDGTFHACYKARLVFELKHHLVVDSRGVAELRVQVLVIKWIINWSLGVLLVLGLITVRTEWEEWSCPIKQPCRGIIVSLSTLKHTFLKIK